MQVKGIEQTRYIVLDVVENVTSPDAADNTGRTLGDLKIIGFLSSPADDGAGFHVDTENGRTYVRDSSTGETYVEARGFARAMEALALVFDTTVTVSADLGVGGGKVSSVVGTYGEQFATWAQNRAADQAEAVEADDMPTPVQAAYERMTASDASDVAPAVEVEAVHAIGREAMFCGLPMDAPVRAFTRMSYVTCPDCLSSAPVIKTADRVKVTDGMAVWDYDLNPGRIDLGSLTADGWFDVIKADGSRSLMDGSRVVTVWNGKTAEAALIPAPVAEAAPVEAEAAEAAPFSASWGDGIKSGRVWSASGKLIAPVEAAPVPVFTAETEAEINALDEIFGVISDDCVCDSIMSAGPSHVERTCPGCGSIFEAVPRVAVRIGDTFTDTVAEVTVTVAATAFLGCPDILFTDPEGSFFRVPPMLLACRVRDGEYVRQTRPGHLVTSTPVRTLMRRRARKAARKAARVGR